MHAAANRSDSSLERVIQRWAGVCHWLSPAGMWASDVTLLRAQQTLIPLGDKGGAG